ncbi:hypothetical protein O181_022911 [Austropuccinia psidii MF-1]|uniref:Reverse transcriptase Ty1/copia-type domain-containing protein n=1 Tax=Austropuccinia psidii MF-1 TaxID=1389203 RepID=A0A9Q3CDU2_9BASI|nr:hypothetical protein [Austropuccinia psidii MF-1]
MSLGQVPTEFFFKHEEEAIESVPLAKGILIPDHLGEAIPGSHKQHWEMVCLNKLHQMEKQGVWQVIDKTQGMKTIGHFWVFDTKLNESGNIKKFNTRLVAHGDWQHLEIDCMERYAPTASLMSLRLLLATTCLQQWKVCSFNVSGAYLYSTVEETVLIELTTHFLPSLKGKVLLLKKSSIRHETGGPLYKTIIAIWTHIDDGIIISNSPAAIKKFWESLCKNFEIKWSDTMKQLMGLECAFGEGEVAILQSILTNDILDAYPRRVISDWITHLPHQRIVAGPDLCCELPGPNGRPLGPVGPPCGIPTQDAWAQYYSTSGGVLSQPVE